MVDEKSVTRVLNGNVRNGGGVSGHYHRNGSSNMMNSNGKINYQRSHHTNGCMTINSKTSTANGFHNNNSSSTMINNKQRPSSVSSLLSNSDSSYYSSNDSNTNSSGSGQSTDWSLDTDGDSSSSGDYEYGPGIVHRLRHKFMTLSTKQHQNNQQNRLQKKCLSSVNVSTLIKRCTSLEELTFEQFKQQMQQQTMNKTTDIKQQESITAVNKRLINNNHCNNNHHQMVNGTKKKLLFMQQQQQQNLSQQQMSTTNGHYHQKQSQQQSNNLKKKSLPPPIVNKSFSTTNLNHRTTTSLYPTNVVQKFVENVQQNKLKKPPPPPPQRINSSLSTTTTKTLTNNGRLCNTSSSSTNHCQLSLMSNNSTSIASNIATATTTITSPAAILSSMNIQAEQQQKEIGSRQHPHDYLHTATTIKQNCFIQKNEISNNDNATSAATISSLNSGDGYMNGTAMTTTTATTALMSNDIDSSQTSTTTSLSSTSTTSNILLLSTPQPYIKRAKSVETLSSTTTLNKSAIDDDENGNDQEMLNENVDSESSTLSSLTLKEDEPILPTEIIDSFNHSQQQDNLNVDVGDNIQQRQVFIDDHNKKQIANAVKDLAMTSLKSNTSAITPATSSTLNLNPVADHNTSASQSTSCSNDNDDDVVDDGACCVVGDNVNKLVHEETRQLEQLEQQQKQSNITNPSKPLEENLIKLTKIDNEQDIDILEKRNIRIQSPHQQQQQETTMTTSISTTTKTTIITTRSSSNELPKPDTVKTVKRIFEHQNNKSSSSLSPTFKINSNYNQSKSSSVINERKGIVSNKFSNTLASSTKTSSSINQNRSNTKTTVTKTNANKPAIASRQNLPQTIAKQRSTESTLNRNVNGTTINRSNGICTNIVGSSNRGSTNKSSTINGVSGGNKKHYPAPKPPKASDQQRLNDEKSIVTTELSSLISTQETISNNLINSAISDSLCNNNSQTKLSQTKDNSNPVFKDTSGFEDDNNNNNNDDENNKIDKINDNGVMAKQSDSNQKDDELFPVNGKQYDENKSVEIITEKIDNVVDLLVETQNEHSHSFSMNSKLQTNLKKPVANIRPFNSTTATVKNVQSKESVVDNNDSLKESSPISSNKKNYSHESSSIDEPIKTLKPSLLQQNRNSLTNGHHDNIDSSSSLSSSIAKSTLWSTNLKSSSTTTATNSIKSTTVQNGCSSMVFDFRSTKNIKPNIAIQPTPFGAKPIPKRLIKELVNGNGNHNQRSSVINNNNDTDDEDDNNYSGMTEIPPPCGIIFIGENMIISNGSLMIKRNKNLSVRFDNSIPSVFEYPMVEDDNDTDDDAVDDGKNERKTDESTKSMVSNLVNSLTKSDIKTPNSINATTAANGVLKKSLPTGNSNLASYKPSKMPGQSTFELGVTKTVPNSFNCNTQQESIDDNNDHCDSMGDFDSLRPIPIKPASIEDTVPFSRSATASDLLF
uniref:Uncharacterized protein n=1 Tax=Dermatophagoides pteronyssinus TaxID=6956 RepID=A0A6P6XRY0_DERPT|nr:putative uncharacterized protein DDB_G0282133 isoform X1 [Dermatophagoides pteronyssinus]